MRLLQKNVLPTGLLPSVRNGLMRNKTQVSWGPVLLEQGSQPHANRPRGWLITASIHWVVGMCTHNLTTETSFAREA